jgi:hypothetical protein
MGRETAAGFLATLEAASERHFLPSALVKAISGNERLDQVILKFKELPRLILRTLWLGRG